MALILTRLDNLEPLDEKRLTKFMFHDENAWVYRYDDHIVLANHLIMFVGQPSIGMVFPVTKDTESFSPDDIMEMANEDQLGKFHHEFYDRYLQSGIINDKGEFLGFPEQAKK